MSLFACGLALVTIYARFFDPIVYHYSPDSSGYIERARIFLEEGHLPAFRLFPPGFTILIATAGVVGIEPSNAALWIPRLCYALVPVVITFSLSTVLERWSAIALAVLVSLSPGLLKVGFFALSDTVFFVLIVGSFGFLLLSMERDRLSSAILSGLLLGFAYILRNAGLAAFLAIFSSLFAALLLKIITRRKLLFITIGVMTGAVIPVLALLIYNYNEFGQFQPYSMAPSDVGFLTNVRVYFYHVILDLTASKSLANIAWDIWLFIVFVGAFFGLILSLVWNRWAQLRALDKFGLLLFSAYAGAGASMVVLARTKYQWGEMINLRHVVQYSWLILTILGILLVGKKRLVGKKGIIAFIFLIALLLTLRFVYIGEMYSRELVINQQLSSSSSVLEAEARLPNKSWVLRGQLKKKIATNKYLMSKIMAIEESALILSNVAEVIRIETGRQVTTLEFGDDVRVLVLKLNRLLSVSNKNIPVHVLIFPTNSLLRKEVWRDILKLKPSCNFSIMSESSDIVWLRSRVCEP